VKRKHMEHIRPLGKCLIKWGYITHYFFYYINECKRVVYIILIVEILCARYKNN